MDPQDPLSTAIHASGNSAIRPSNGWMNQGGCHSTKTATFATFWFVAVCKNSESLVRFWREMTGIVTLKNGWLWQCFCSNLWSLYVSNGSYIWRHQRHALLGVSIKSTAAEGRPRVTLTWKVWAFCGNDTWEMFDAQSFSDVLRCHLEGFSQWAMLFLNSIWAMWVS